MKSIVRQDCDRSEPFGILRFYLRTIITYGDERVIISTKGKSANPVSGRYSEFNGHAIYKSIAKYEKMINGKWPGVFNNLGIIDELSYYNDKDAWNMHQDTVQKMQSKLIKGEIVIIEEKGENGY